MTNIYINREGSEYQLLVLGHAGYGSSGTDIVCAAISTLVFTFLEIVEKKSDEKIFFIKKYQESDGMINVIVSGESLEFKGICETIESGFEMLEREYGEYLGVSRGEKIF